jgi:REP element-mobilizing transposase RayT
MPDHVHILIGLKPNKALSDLVRDIKANSSRFINEKAWINGKFEWQTDLEHSPTAIHTQLTNVINYIQNQEEHHKTKTFKEEYVEFFKIV